MGKILTKLLGIGCCVVAISGLGLKESYHSREHPFQKKDYTEMNAPEVVSAIGTFDEAKDYILNNIFPEDHEGFRSFEDIHKRGRGLCRDAAWAALVLLSDNQDKYNVTLMDLRPKDLRQSGHAVALVRDLTTKKFGSLGINSADCIAPEYNSIQEVYNQINSAFSFKYNEKFCNFLVFKKGKIVQLDGRYSLHKNRFEN